VFWAEATRALTDPSLPTAYEVRWIGLDDDTTREVIELIRSGNKTGTFTLPWIVARTDQPTPAIGAAIILVDFQGHPRLLVRLTRIEEVAFGDITAAHTSIDGTPVRDLAVWKPLHTHYWNGMLEPYGLAVHDEMPVWVETFDLCYDRDASGESVRAERQ